VTAETSKPVAVRILDKEYRIGCPAGEEDRLLAAARMLDERMKEIRRGGSVIGTERIAIVTALNLAHELLSNPPQEGEQVDALGPRVRSLRERIETALNETNQLEL
jgi:cell division protein ZapA